MSDMSKDCHVDPITIEERARQMRADALAGYVRALAHGLSEAFAARFGRGGRPA